MLRTKVTQQLELSPWIRKDALKRMLSHWQKLHLVAANRRMPKGADDKPQKAVDLEQSIAPPLVSQHRILAWSIWP